MKKMLSIAAVAALATSSFAASDLAGAFKEGKTSGQIRAMYLKNDLSSAANSGGTLDKSAFGLGGKLSYETAPLYGISAGVGFYTSQDMGTKDNDTGKRNTDMLSESGNSYSLLGQAYLQGQFGKTTVKLGRQQLDTPLAGSDDIRMIPNLFEAAVVINTDLPDTTLIGAYVARMAGWDSAASSTGIPSALGVSTSTSIDSRTAFHSMSRAALGTAADVDAGHGDVGDNGVYVIAAVNSSIKNLTLQAWDYYAVDVVNAVYLQADYKLGIAKDMDLGLAAQYYNIAGMGKTKDLLNDVNLGKIDYSVLGAKASLSTPIGLTPYLAYNKVSEQDDRNGGTFVFGAWGGYPEFAIAEEFWYNSFGTAATASFAMNGANVWKAGVDYSLEKLGLGARTIGLGYTNFDLKDKYNGNIDADAKVWDIIYTCSGALVKNLDAKIAYTSIDRKDSANDRQVFKAVFNYNF